jgi:hypothetical protein
LNWLLEGLVVNIIWAFIIWFTKPIKKETIKQINIDKIKNYLGVRIIVFMTFSLLAPFLLINLFSKDKISVFLSFITFLNFFAILFQFLKDLNSFLENITIKKKYKRPK